MKLGLAGDVIFMNKKEPPGLFELIRIFWIESTTTKKILTLFCVLLFLVGVTLFSILLYAFSGLVQIARALISFIPGAGSHYRPSLIGDLIQFACEYWRGLLVLVGMVCGVRWCLKRKGII